MRVIAAIMLAGIASTAQAWDEQQVLEYITAHNPMLQAYRTSMTYYTPPGAMQRILEHTQVYGRAGVGGTNFLGADEQPITLQAGVQMNIPLSSRKERREWAAKGIEEVRALDEIRTRVFEDISLLRQHEADLEAAEMKAKFLGQKKDWAKKRVDQGYDALDLLWETVSQLSDQKAEAKRLTKLRDAQRQRVAWHAGGFWKPLLMYLQGKTANLDDSKTTAAAAGKG